MITPPDSRWNIALVSGQIRGPEAAAALSADWVFTTGSASFLLDTSEVWASVLWRIGRAAFRLHLLEPQPLEAAAAVRWGVADILVPSSADPIEWSSRWMGERSTPAFVVASGLIARRGGDRLERAEFARLFAAGEPQIGLHAFLQKQRPEWEERGTQDKVIQLCPSLENES